MQRLKIMPIEVVDRGALASWILDARLNITVRRLCQVSNFWSLR